MQIGTVSRTLTLAGDLEDSKSTSGGTLCVFWTSHTFVPISWMCKKQTSVSHSSTESEHYLSGHWIETGWFACSGIVGSNCFCLWNISHSSDRTGQPVNGKDKSHNKIDVILDIDSVPSKMSNPQVVKLCCMCLRTMKL